VRNVVEELVRREYDRLAPTIEGFCGCELCRDDVMVYALNRLKPRYVTQPLGEVLTNVDLTEHQPQADAVTVLLEGFRVVAATPRKGHQP
jgi:competence protein ComFB